MVAGDPLAHSIAHELVEAEAAADFPRLGRVPSSTVRHFVDYYRQLSAADAAELRSALAVRGALALRPMRGPGSSFELDPAYERWATAKAAAGFGPGGVYQPLRVTKNIVGAGLASESNLDPETAERLAETKAATATQLRKLIKPVFSERFGLVARKDRGGNWTYERDDGSLKVRIDFGGRSDQLRYSVTATDPVSRSRVAMATYEGLVGLFGGWDWVVEEEAADAVELLADLVNVIEALAQRLGPDGPVQARRA